MPVRATAATGSTIPAPTPVVDGAGDAVARISSRTRAGEVSGARDRISAAVPDTNGAAKLVPTIGVAFEPLTCRSAHVSPLGDGPATGPPGAATSTQSAATAYPAGAWSTASGSSACRAPGSPGRSTAVTAMTSSRIAGHATAPSGHSPPMFPDAATTTAPDSSARCTAAVISGAPGGTIPGGAHEVSEMLMTLAPCPTAESTALANDASVPSSPVVCRMLSTRAPGATPAKESSPGRPAASPATKVPWASQSWKAPAPPVTSPPSATPPKRG